MKSVLVGIILIFCTLIAARAQTSMASPFGDHMVLQRNAEVAIWGKDQPGENIKISASWGAKSSALCDKSGRWQTKISTANAGGPYELTIKGSEKLKLNDVMLGEVWLCSGQSNMKMPLKGNPGQPIHGSADAILNSKNTNLRFFKVAQNVSTTPLESCDGKWELSEPSSASEFSAVAYFYACMLQDMLDVPIGLIQSTWGGSPAEAWTPEVKLKSEFSEFESKINDTSAYFHKTPTALFNGMIHPLLPFTIKGVIWYQGEANRKAAEQYDKLFPAMIESWRSAWDQGDFPFYYVQIAPLGYGDPAQHVRLQESQLKTMLSVPNTGMVVTLDIGDQKTIHPPRKKEVGERLALWALAKDYGYEGITYCGPVYKSMEISDGVASLEFDHAPQGVFNFGNELDDFEIAGRDMIYHPAEAEIQNGQLKVWSEHVPEPEAVRYAWTNWVEPSLFNTAGLPASPFRTREFNYKADWESIRSHYQIPEWFKDAKFGIFIHWGPYTVPAYCNTKYPKYMYYPDWERRGMSPFKHHLETYGDLSTFGYKDFIPMFKAEKFDAREWVSLFKEAGARYVVPVAEHHDAYAMYNSNHTRWNAVKTGPNKDILKLISKACMEEDLKFGASSHLANWRGFYSKRNPSWDTNDPKNYDLYWKPIEKGSLPSEEFLQHWWDRTTDIIDQYEPDLIWFDFGIDKPGFEPLHKKILAYYYNKGLEWNKEVVFQDKNMKNKSFPEDLIVLDIERGRMESIYKFPWQTDTSVGKNTWSYVPNEDYKTSDYLLDELIDIVSKNGCLLLNVNPKSDGTIPAETQKILREMGAWLSLNGEAIYETRPWKIYGEGPTKVSTGHHSEGENVESGPEDIRFTTKGDVIYVTALGWPEDGTFTIRSLARENPYESRAIKSIEFISGKNSIAWQQSNEALLINVDSAKPCEAAYVFRISFGD